VDWIAVDVTSGVQQVKIRIDGGEWINLTGSGMSIMGSHEFINLTSAVHVVDVWAVDVVGNVGTKSVTFTVDMVEPQVAITNPENAQRTNVLALNLTWTASDALTGISNISVKVDGDNWMYLMATDRFLIIPGLAAGEHTILVKAVDGVDNNFTATVTFTIDRTTPAVMGHTPTGTSVAISSAISVTFSEAMDPSTVTIAVTGGVTGVITWNGNHTIATLTPAAAMAYATNYTVTVNGHDAAGNSLAQYQWTFSTKVMITGIVHDDKGNALANATVTLVVGSHTVATTNTSATGSYTFVVDPGTYDLKVNKGGFQETVKNITVGPGRDNNVATISLTPNPDYTLVIVGVVAILAIVGVLLYMFRFRKK
jgi:hypothetical protein